MSALGIPPARWAAWAVGRIPRGLLAVSALGIHPVMVGGVGRGPNPPGLVGGVGRWPNPPGPVGGVGRRNGVGLLR